MLFDSPIYLLCLGLITLIYWQLSHRKQNLMLLGFSYLFYAWWDWRFLWLIVFSSVIDFFLALKIADSHDPHKRRSALITSITLNLGFLGFFKYFNFFVDSLHVALLSVGIESSKPLLEILLPPGISFYTFQAIAYIVDVHNRRIEPVRSITNYSLFISLFPHLIAGPIQRPEHLIPQVNQPRTFEARKVSDGLMLIASGLFRKCVIADQCSVIANAAFSGALGPTGTLNTLIGMYAFAWQIYGDFSGYSNIARGSAQLLGFHFMVNFKQPYLSTSIQEFWRRWHISLSTWLRDYLYIPLGGNQGGERKTYRNLFLTMLIGGLWHGANWTFVIWGALHGAWLAIARKTSERRPVAADPSLLKIWLQRAFVFHLVCVAWIFFRADNVGAASQMITALADFHWDRVYLPAAGVVGLFGGTLLVIDVLEARRGEEYLLERASIGARSALAAALVLLTLLFSAPETGTFIYFQF